MFLIRFWRVLTKKDIYIFMAPDFVLIRIRNTEDLAWPVKDLDAEDGQVGPGTRAQHSQEIITHNLTIQTVLQIRSQHFFRRAGVKIWRQLLLHS